MGVTGLWRLIDASGKPVPLESLEGKVLAIDVSIWIHQVLQGYQDRKGSAIPNAHLLGLFNRICKLLYFKIKPVFVFDGGVPLLKKNTIAARKKQKAITAGKAEKMKNDLLLNLMKHSLVKGVLTKKTNEEMDAPSTSSSSKASANLNSINDMFKLPLAPTILSPESSDSESSSDELSPRKQSKWKGNIHTVDITTEDFKTLPPDVRYDILTDLKETRKQNSWGRLHEIPEESNQFSNYQMKRLLKRRQAQELLESAEQEMGGKNLTLEELETLMAEQGVDTKSRDLAYRIASDATTRMIYINDPKSRQITKQDSGVVSDLSQPSCSKDSKEEQLPSIPEESSVLENIQEYDLDDWDSDIEFLDESVASPKVKRYFGKMANNPAFAYMVENSELSQEQILQLIEQSKESVRKAKVEERAKRKKSRDEHDLKRIKSKKDFDIAEFIGIKEEVDSIEEISSDDHDYENYETEKSVTEISNDTSKLTSDSDSDDFVEVQDVPIPKFKCAKKMEIVIKPSEGIEDDLFADIFVKKPNEDISSDLADKLKRSDQVFEVEKLNSKEQDDEIMAFTPEKCKTVQNTTKEDIADVMPTRVSPSFEVMVILEENIENSSDTEQNVEKVTHQDPITQLKPSALNDNHVNVNSNAENASNSLQLDKPKGSPPKEIFSSRVVSPPKEISSNVISPPKEMSSTNVVSSPMEISSSSSKVVSPPQQIPSSRVTNLMTRLESEKPQLLSKASNSKALEQLQSQLETETLNLKRNIGKLDRQSTEVTEQMRSDAQDLLRLFGIPYIVAPQEAEAQCAYLEAINLTDGSITDDSDIWLFGARCVYRNFFNNTKRVMQYLSKDIEHHFKLTRQQMIQLALLVGSDYTVGIPGIGPVTAMEVLASFPADGDDLLRGLTNFSSWIRGGRVVGPGKAALRNKLKNIAVDRAFPSQAVVQAYLFPTVDESRETFSWGKPNLVLLGDYTREKFGWTKLKFEETMGPVMKRLEAKSQKDIMAYFKVKSIPKGIDKGLSKRLQKAVERIGKGGEDDDDDDGGEGVGESGVKRKKRRVLKNKGNDLTDLVADGDINVHDDDEDDEDADKGGKKVVKPVNEVIPQRVKDRQNALNKKLKAIEVFRKSRKGPGKSKGKSVRPQRNAVRQEANLSESSSDSD